MQSACSLNIWRLFSLCECSRSCSLCRFIWLFLSAVIFYFPFHMHFLFSYIWLYMYFVCSLWWFTWLFSFYLLLCSFVLYFISSFVGRLFGWRSFWIWDHQVVCNVCWFRFRSGMQFVCSLNVRRLFSSCARQLSFSLRLLVICLLFLLAALLFLICMVLMIDHLSVLCMVHLVLLYSEAVICSCMVILFFSPSTSWSIWSFHLSGHPYNPTIAYLAAQRINISTQLRIDWWTNWRFWPVS